MTTDTCTRLLTALTDAGLRPRANGETPCCRYTHGKHVFYQVVTDYAPVQAAALDTVLRKHGWALVSVVNSYKHFLTVTVREVSE